MPAAGMGEDAAVVGMVAAAIVEVAGVAAVGAAGVVGMVVAWG
jgi:hypothetical protein